MADATTAAAPLATDATQPTAADASIAEKKATDKAAADAVVATDRALACASKMVPVNISQQFQRAFAVLQHDGSEENFANARSLAAIDCPPDCLARVWVLLALNQPLPAHAWLQDARQVRCPDFFTVRDDPRLRPWREWLPDLWLR